MRAVADHGCKRLIKNVLEALTGQCRALEVLQSVDLLRLLSALLGIDGLLALLLELLKSLLVSAQINLGADQDDGNLGAVVLELNTKRAQHRQDLIKLGVYLRPPSILDVDERRMINDREADEEDVGLGVRQSTNASVTLLASGIPERELHLLALNDNRCLVVVWARSASARWQSSTHRTQWARIPWGTCSGCS